MKNYEVVDLDVNEVEKNDRFVCRELGGIDAALYIDQEIVESLNRKFSFEVTDIIKQKIKHTTSKVFNDFQNTFYQKHHANFAIFVDEAILFQQSDLTYYRNFYKDIFDKLDCIKDGSVNPWDLNFDYYSRLSNATNIKMQLILRKISEHVPVVKESSISSLCARSDRDLSSKQRKNALSDAILKVLLADHSKRKKEFLKELQEHSMITTY